MGNNIEQIKDKARVRGSGHPATCALEPFQENAEGSHIKAAGISIEGANLSGLPEEPSELVTLLCNMARELYEKKEENKVKQKRKKEKEAAMSIQEKWTLAQ